MIPKVLRHADAVRRHPEGSRPCTPPRTFSTEFDQSPSVPLRLLNVDLSTVTTAADFIVGLGDPLAEVVHFDFQSSAAAWKHADILVYNALTHAAYHVPVHSIILLLRPQAAHANLNGLVSYAALSGAYHEL